MKFPLPTSQSVVATALSIQRVRPDDFWGAVPHSWTSSTRLQIVHPVIPVRLNCSNRVIAMITSLWTLCQTCPSGGQQMDARGKYRWTEYRDIQSAAARVIQHAPQPSSTSVGRSVAEPIPVKDHPQRDNVLRNDSAGPTLMEPAAIVPAHLRIIDNPQYYYGQQGFRRTQSEGPSAIQTDRRHQEQSQQNPLSGGGGGGGEPVGPMAAWVGRRRHVTEQQRPEHWNIISGSSVQEHQTVNEAFRSIGGHVNHNKSSSEQQFNWPAGKSSYGNNRRMPAESMESVLHHQQYSKQQPLEGSAAAPSSVEALGNHHQASGYDQADQPRRRRYKTEYKKKFRPFSLYHYVDGRFQKADKGADAVGVANTSSANPGPDGQDTWYREVIELRKKAGEYKYRGLGGELMPQHMADLYAKQFEVWEQVSRRSSLSALALAATTPRPSEGKGGEGKSSVAGSKRGSPAKTSTGSTAAARPGHAQPVLKDTNRAEAPAAGADRPRRERTTVSQRSVSVEAKARARSARRIKSPSHGPPPVSSSGVAVNVVRPSLGAIFHPANKVSARSASVGPERRMPKSSSTHSNHSVGSTSKGRPPAAVHNNNDGTAAPPVKVIPRHSAEEKENVLSGHPEDTNNGDGPSSLPTTLSSLPATLIKALAEPTRVKSPEMSVVRSPDPVNWTVPLDTGKCFTVTQNIRGGDGSRPHSELKFNMIVRPPPSSSAPIHPPATSNGKSDPAGIPPVGAAPGVPAAKEDAGADPEPAKSIEINKKEDGPAPSIQKEMTGKEEETIVRPVEVEEEKQPLITKDPEEDPLNVAAINLKKEEKDPLEAVTTVVPGTTLRRLEDPTPFLFSSHRPGSLDTACPPSAPKPAGPRYRVLEAPEPDDKPVIMPASTSMTFGASPYKVLEAPTTPPGSSSPSSANRSMASDVLEKARTRFDRFWSKKDADK